MNASERNLNGFTRGRLLARNTLWNMVGLGLPLLVAVFAIPLLVVGLGTDRFGILTLAWVGIGYFNLFDLGLGRALTKLVAEKLGVASEREISALIWTALSLMLALGLAGAAAGMVFSSWIVRDVLRIPDELLRESLASFILLSLAIPAVILTTGLRGVLEAKQRFSLVNALRIPMGIFTFLGPLLVLPFSVRLSAIVAVLFLGRWAFCLAHFIACLKEFPEIRGRFEFQRGLVAPLLRFGGWMTVSNTISPFMVYMDRFLIGALVSVAAVAYYSTPWEVITKILIIPSSFAAVLFPAFSYSYEKDIRRVSFLYRRGVMAIFAVLFPLTIGVVVFAKDGLLLWLGTEFAEQGYRVAQILAVGTMVNGVAAIPFALIQGSGRPDITAKLHMVELIAYLPVLYVLVTKFGIIGAAAAWMLRTSADMVCLLAVARRRLDFLCSRSL